jgi:hypothetical protein
MSEKGEATVAKDGPGSVKTGSGGFLPLERRVDRAA